MVTTTNILALVVASVYLLGVIGVGYFAARATGSTREDFFMASRSFGTVVLLFALFATNMTAVVMIGAPGLAYQTGVGAYGFFIALFAFLFPVFLMTFGYRVWLVGKKFDHITPGQIVNHRWNAQYLGMLVMVMFTIWTIPYILVGVQGGGIVFEGLTNGLIPYWLGALIVLIVVGLYVYPGGMRGTGWTNTFQGIVFMIILLGMLIYIPMRIGGFDTATQAVANLADGTYLNRAGVPPFQPRMYFSQGIIIALGAFMFPHLFIRYMTARSVQTLRQISILYPLAVLFVWGTAVLLGFWGIAQVPNLDNPDFILPTLVFELMPFWVIGLALAGLLAAIMSSIDGQVLTLSTFFTEDFLSEVKDDISDENAVWYTRVFLVTIFVIAYIGALITSETIVDTATFLVAGYGLMFFPMASAFYWRRSTKEAIYVGLLYGFCGLWLSEYILPDSFVNAFSFGFHPFVPLLITQIILMVIIAYATTTPPEKIIREYEELFESVW